MNSASRAGLFMNNDKCCMFVVCYLVPCFGWDACMVGSDWAKSCMLVHI